MNQYYTYVLLVKKDRNVVQNFVCEMYFPQEFRLQCPRLQGERKQFLRGKEKYQNSGKFSEIISIFPTPNITMYIKSRLP